MPSLSSLTRSLISQIDSRKNDAYLIDLSLENEQPEDNTENTNQSLAFQYWPETITDTKAQNYQQKEVPGASLPIYQWINGGERMITFDAVFTTDVDLIDASPPPGVLGTNGNNEIVNRLKQAGVQRRNVDIRAAVVWLRRYMYPTYGTIRGGQVGIVRAPKKLSLVLPNSGIGLAGANHRNPNSVRVYMTQCDINYEQFFPNGLPRIAVVQLGFAETAQYAGNIEFPQRTQDLDKELNLNSPHTTGYTFIPNTIKTS